MKSRRKRRSENSTDKAFTGILYPNSLQREQIAKTLGSCRYVYNHFLDERIQTYKEQGKSVTFKEQQNALPVMKETEETKWLKEIDSTALQSSLRDLQNAFDNFFRGIKEGKKTGFPKFKSKHSGHASYRSISNNNSIQVIDSTHIRLPKLGTVRCRIPRCPKGRILHATVTREADGGYTVSIMSEEPAEVIPEKTGKAVGVDLGIKTLAVTSDGQEYDNPATYRKNLKKLRRENRKLSRKSKDSRNREKQRKKVARLHRKIRNQRMDAIHKMTHDLTERYDTIYIEDLDVAAMKKNRRLARDISDAAFGEIKRQLDYKAKWKGRETKKVDRWLPTSQICSCCGCIHPLVKDLPIRYWKCLECGAEHDRDINAAINILHAGLAGEQT